MVSFLIKLNQDGFKEGEEEGGSGPDLHFLMNNASYTNEKVGGIQN